jgi:hypothetical protein
LFVTRVVVVFSCYSFYVFETVLLCRDACVRFSTFLSNYSANDFDPLHVLRPSRRKQVWLMRGTFISTFKITSLNIFVTGTSAVGIKYKLSVTLVHLLLCLVTVLSRMQKLERTMRYLYFIANFLFCLGNSWVLHCNLVCRAPFSDGDPAPADFPYYFYSRYIDICIF